MVVDKGRVGLVVSFWRTMNWRDRCGAKDSSHMRRRAYRALLETGQGPFSDGGSPFYGDLDGGAGGVFGDGSRPPDHRPREARGEEREKSVDTTPHGELTSQIVKFCRCNRGKRGKKDIAPPSQLLQGQRAGSNRRLPVPASQDWISVSGTAGCARDLPGREKVGRQGPT